MHKIIKKISIYNLRPENVDLMALDIMSWLDSLNIDIYIKKEINRDPVYQDFKQGKGLDPLTLCSSSHFVRDVVTKNIYDFCIYPYEPEFTTMIYSIVFCLEKEFSFSFKLFEKDMVYQELKLVWIN